MYFILSHLYIIVASVIGGIVWAFEVNGYVWPDWRDRVRSAGYALPWAVLWPLWIPAAIVSRVYWKIRQQKEVKETK